MPIYVVGGYVRNSLAGLPPSDIDLAGPTIPAILGLEPKYRVRVVNFSLGTAIIKAGAEEYEYTPFRIEHYSEGGHHAPSSVLFTSDMKVDAARRDFTCNSVYYDPIKDELYDFFGGMADIEKKIIRAHAPDKIFASDGLRILRLVRQACELGYKIEGNTAKAAMQHAPLLNDISAERKRDELIKILNADTKYGIEDAHYRGLKLLHKMGLWKYLIPDVDECEGVAQNPLYHKYDVLEHTFRAVRYAPPRVRLAALMHDLGKPYCVRKYGNMHGHEKASENIARFRLGQNGLKFPNNVVEETARLCALHMYDVSGQARENTLKMFIAKNYDIIDRLVDLNEADTKATGTIAETDDEHRFTRLKWQLVEQNAPIYREDLFIDGTDVTGAGFSGTDVGAVMDELHRDCLLDPKLNNREWLLGRIAKMAKAAKVSK